MYENISPSISLTQYLASGRYDIVDLANIISQITLSMNLAHEKFGFVHYDLHTDNIMIRKLDDDRSIPYTYDGQRVFIDSSFVATVIDYGRSRYQYSDTWFGYENSKDRANGLYSDIPFAFSDVVKILSSIWIKTQDKFIWNLLDTLIEGNDEKKKKEDITSLRFSAFRPPISGPKVLEFRWTELLEIMKAVLPKYGYNLERDVLKTKPSNPILSCNPCRTKEEVYQELKQTGIYGEIVDLVDLYFYYVINEGRKISISIPLSQEQMDSIVDAEKSYISNSLSSIIESRDDSSLADQELDYIETLLLLISELDKETGDVYSLAAKFESQIETLRRIKR